MRLITDWRGNWRYYSTQALAVAAILPVVWMELPPDIKDLLPHAWRPWILTAIAVSGIAGRLIDQGDGKT